MAKRERPLPTQLEAYVLHSYDWSESSLILELFTRERGRLAAVAKGAKRPYSQLRPVLLPFQRIHATLGRSAAQESQEIHLLRQAEWAGGGPMLGGAALFSGFYLNELLLSLLARDDAQARIFDAYRATLPALACGVEALAQAALRAFELVLLHSSGVLPELGLVTQTQQALEPDTPYRLMAEAGLTAASGASGASAANGTNGTNGTADERNAALSGRDWLALQAAMQTCLNHAALGDGLAPLQLECARRPQPLRSALRSLLQHQLGQKPLKTRQVMHSVQRLVDRAA